MDNRNIYTNIYDFVNSILISQNGRWGVWSKKVVGGIQITQ